MKNPMTEIRNPKERRNPKSEPDLLPERAKANSAFGIRISFGSRSSDFGFAIA